MEKNYLIRLAELKNLTAKLPKSRMSYVTMIDALVKLNMSWEALQLDKSLKDHPFESTLKLVNRAIEDIRVWQSLDFCDGNVDPSQNAISKLETAASEMEDKHHSLFQKLWTSFNENQYQERIDLYNFRLKINNLHNGTFTGKRVIDMGCGHGNFAHALLNAGAHSVLGIDYGEESISYALQVRDKFNISPARLNFKIAQVYDVAEPDESFDVAIQNGVFHHLEDEDKAYREMHRLLKPGGLAWIYSEGEGSIARDLFHNSVEILNEVPATLVQEHLLHLGFSINKRYHLGDGLKAVYRATSWEKLKSRLAKIGFTDFQRLKGGMLYDLDIDDSDPWSKEKFGEGDLRFLARKKV